MYHTKGWFIRRISKRIFRDRTKKFCCDSCERVAVEGIVINNELHASYLYDIQNDFGACGEELNYRDKL